VAAYVLPIGLTLAGLGLWRTRSADPAEAAEARRQRAERARERDEALEAAALRSGGPTAPAETDPDDGVDADDHWGPVRRPD
jgi:hypothetical protein